MGTRELDRGHGRLRNWADWALAYSARTGYPQASAFARLYRPEAGDVWDGIEPDEARAVADESDAEQVERFVRRLPLANRRVVMSFYIGRESPVVAARRFGHSRERFYILLDEAAAWCGEVT